MNGWWAGSGIALTVAVLAGIGDWRRSVRRDLDRIGWIDWRSLQMFALIGAVMCAALAWRG